MSAPFRPASSPSADLLETAAAAGSFRILLSAVETAGLAHTLKEEGPFTLFAPADEAFARLPPSFRAEILADRVKLAALAAYHVVPGALSAHDLAGRASAPTLEGSRLDFTTSPGVRVDGVSVVRADIEARNGLIHVIDAVLVPK